MHRSHHHLIAPIPEGYIRSFLWFLFWSLVVAFLCCAASTRFFNDATPIRFYAYVVVLALISTIVMGATHVALKILDYLFRCPWRNFLVVVLVAVVVLMVQSLLFDTWFFVTLLLGGQPLPDAAAAACAVVVEFGNVMSNEAWVQWASSPLLTGHAKFQQCQAVGCLAVALYLLHACRLRVSVALSVAGVDLRVTCDGNQQPTGPDGTVQGTPPWKHVYVFAPDRLQCSVYCALAWLACALPAAQVAHLLAFVLCLYLLYAFAVDGHGSFTWTFYGFRAEPYDPAAANPHELTCKRHACFAVYLALVAAVLVSDACAHQADPPRTKLYQLVQFFGGLVEDCGRMSLHFDSAFAKIQYLADELTVVIRDGPGWFGTACVNIGLFLMDIGNAMITTFGPRAGMGVTKVFTSLPARVALMMGGGDGSNATGPLYRLKLTPTGASDPLATPEERLIANTSANHDDSSIVNVSEATPTPPPPQPPEAVVEEGGEEEEEEDGGGEEEEGEEEEEDEEDETATSA